MCIRDRGSASDRRVRWLSWWGDVAGCGESWWYTTARWLWRCAMAKRLIHDERHPGRACEPGRGLPGPHLSQRLRVARTRKGLDLGPPEYPSTSSTTCRSPLSLLDRRPNHPIGIRSAEGCGDSDHRAWCGVFAIRGSTPRARLAARG